VLRIDPVDAPPRRASAWQAVLRSRWWRALRRGPARRVYEWLAPVRSMWRRSLQFRVVSITLVLSGVLVASFGLLVANQITKGLLEKEQNRTKGVVEQGAEYARSQLRVDGERDRALLTAVPVVLNTLESRVRESSTLETGAQNSELRESGVQVAIVPFSSSLLSPQAVPANDGALAVVQSTDLARLREGVQRGDVLRQYVTANPDGKGVRPFLAYGALIRTQAGDLGLYYLFPLDDEVASAYLVSTSVALTGTTLVALLAVLAGLVTSMVVRPVRVAARTAQRLSAGLLDQRMEVRGEDDLALLGASFNQMAANLQRQIERLEEMSRLQRRFTSDVSHELRTPLTTVRMAADLIFTTREDFDPAVARSAEILQGELDRFEELLSDLLEISRFDAGFAVLEAEPADLVPVVCGAVDRLAPLAERAGTRITVDVPDQSVIAEVDQRRVDRILRNLIGNAVEHGERKPVRVVLACDDSAVAVIVRDRGIGMKPGEDKLVFNRFWRADPSRARQTGGSGLGLSISLEDARLHGGWLQAWGAPGEGAQFRLTLPLRAGDRITTSPLPLEPDDAVSDDAVSDDAVSDDAVSDDAVSDDAVSDDVGPDDAVSDDVGPDDAVSDDAVSDDVGPDDAMPDDVGPDGAMPAAEATKPEAAGATEDAEQEDAEQEDAEQEDAEQEDAEQEDAEQEDAEQEEPAVRSTQ
jgi:two-component system, OmpR family, sensor histidine kinase MtrB